MRLKTLTIQGCKISRRRHCCFIRPILQDMNLICRLLLVFCNPRCSYQPQCVIPPRKTTLISGLRSHFLHSHKLGNGDRPPLKRDLGEEFLFDDIDIEHYSCLFQGGSWFYSTIFESSWSNLVTCLSILLKYFTLFFQNFGWERL